MKGEQIMKKWKRAEHKDIKHNTEVRIIKQNRTFEGDVKDMHRTNYLVRGIDLNNAYIQSIHDCTNGNTRQRFEYPINRLAVQVEVEDPYVSSIPYEPKVGDTIITNKQQVLNVDKIYHGNMIVGTLLGGKALDYAITFKDLMKTLENSPVYVIMRDDHILFSKFLKED